jgi:hypothetical protein
MVFSAFGLAAGRNPARPRQGRPIDRKRAGVGLNATATAPSDSLPPDSGCVPAGIHGLNVRAVDDDDYPAV